MTTGIELLEEVYEQLRAAGVVQSKREFSEKLLGRSPSYLTSMRAKQRTVSDEIIMVLGDAVWSVMKNRLHEADAEMIGVLRRAVARVNTYLADRTIPAGLKDNAEAPQLECSTPLPLWLRVVSSAGRFWRQMT